jgi:hypothetical protein
MSNSKRQKKKLRNAERKGTVAVEHKEVLQLRPDVEDRERIASIEEIEILVTQSTCPQFVEKVEAFCDAYRLGDAVVEFCSSAGTWDQLMGWHGFVLKRGGESICSLMCMMN